MVHKYKENKRKCKTITINIDIQTDTSGIASFEMQYNFNFPNFKSTNNVILTNSTEIKDLLHSQSLVWKAEIPKDFNQSQTTFRVEPQDRRPLV